MSATATEPPFDARYELGAILGAGGAGTVVAARDLGRPGAPAVALKVLHPELAKEASFRRRFRREGALLESLRHPAIVRILGSGQAPHRGDVELPYLVMERLHGTTLRAALTRGACTRESLLTWLGPVCDALDLTHAADVLHGDLKPENLFLSESGPKLVDFGSAKIHGFPRLTATGEVTGTPVYMAPEVLMGGRELTASADLYALGVMLYEAVSGRPPFSQRHPGRLISAIVNGDVAPPQTADAELAPLSPHILRALAREPGARFQSAQALKGALLGALA